MNTEAPANDNRQLYIEAIQLWVGNIKLAQAMEREELAQLEGVQRHLALSKGLLPNIIRVCRRHPRADTRLGILAIIHLCADNNDGLCRLSIKRFAQLLSRKENSVRSAINGLEKGGEIGVNHNRDGNSYWPKIDKAIAHMSPSMGWFVDALSDKPRSPWRPNKVPPADGGVFSGKSVSPEKVPPAKHESTPRRRGIYIANINRSELDSTVVNYRAATNGQAQALRVRCPPSAEANRSSETH